MHPHLNLGLVAGLIDSESLLFRLIFEAGGSCPAESLEGGGAAADAALVNKLFGLRASCCLLLLDQLL